MTNFFDRVVAAESSTLDHRDASVGGPDAPAIDRTASPEAKEVTQELLRHGYLEEATKPGAFRRAIVDAQQIAAALEPLDLMLRLDTHRGVAFLAVADPAPDSSDDGEAWTHPLVRRQRLTLEQSLLVAILRQAFVMHEQESGVGHSVAKIAVDDLLAQFLMYFGDSGSDARNESRLVNLLDQLKVYGIVSEVDKNQEISIRPLIAHLANPESLSALLRTLQRQTLSKTSQ